VGRCLATTKAENRDVLTGNSRLESRSAALGGSLGAATTTSTIKRRCLCAVARSVFVCRVSGLFAAACACDLLN